MSVIVYSSDLCPFCHRAKGLLASKGVKFREIKVDMEPAIRAEMRERAGGRNTVPQIFIGATHVGGCDDLYDLEGRGELDLLLKKAGVP